MSDNKAKVFLGFSDKNLEGSGDTEMTRPEKKHQELSHERCLSSGCKINPHRFGFCDEHYEQFKFGLINKLGKPVPDFEKKFEHYQAHKAKRGAQKVA